MADCEHIYAYYQRLWELQPCIGYNLLRRYYYRVSRGLDISL